MTRRNLVKPLIVFAFCAAVLFSLSAPLTAGDREDEKKAAGLARAEARIAEAKAVFDKNLAIILDRRKGMPSEGPGRVVGFVIDAETGEVPERARIIGFRGDKWTDARPNDEGAFELEGLEEGMWLVEARGLGYETGSAEVSVIPGQKPGMGKWVVFRLERGNELHAAEVRIFETIEKFERLREKANPPKEGPGRVLGFVIDAETGLVPQGARISGYLTKADSSPLANPRTDGSFELKGMSPALWLIVVKADGYEMARKEVKVTPGEGPGMGSYVIFRLKRWSKGRIDAEERIERAAAAFEELRAIAEFPDEGNGRIVGYCIDSATGEVPANVTITAVNPEIQTFAPVTAKPGPDGAFEFPGCVPGEYRLEANAKGYRKQLTKTKVVPGEGPGMGSWVVFRMLAEKDLYGYHWSEGRREAERRIAEAKAKFEDLHAKAVVEKKIPAEGPGRVVGFVIDAETGEAPASVTIAATRQNVRSAVPTAANAAADGGFEIEGLAPATYRVEARAKGYLSQMTTAKVFPGEGPGMGSWVVFRLEKEN